MIVNYEYQNSKLILSYIDKKGKLQFKNYNWNNPLQWNVTHDSDPSRSTKYRTWDSRSVKLTSVRYPNRYSIYEFLDKLPENEKEDIFSYNEPNMFFCDIEVEITDGFPEAHIADNKVTAVCIINKNTVILLGLKELSDKQISDMEKDINKYFEKYNTQYKIKWYYCEDEKELLNTFFNDAMPKMPVLTGWNFVTYDWVYLVTRARKLGINPNVASPTGKLIRPWKKTKPGQYEKPSYEELPKHRLVFDYMDIFVKWDKSIKIMESSKLDFVASKVLGVKKLELGMSLKDLYHKDWYKYCLYNCIDTALVQQIHNKQRTFDLMLAISNLAKIQIEDSLSAIRVTEGILFKEYLDIGIVMAKGNSNIPIYDSNESENEHEEELSGGYVKFPAVGLKQWITVFDFSSLYPTTMRQFNIAPESYRGIKINDKIALLNGKEYEIKDNDIVLLNGTVFENKDSKTKEILTNLFTKRKAEKNLSLGHKKQKQLLNDYLKSRA